jgi:glycosyltransferase involved in cell wall biosynthesis
MGKLLVTNRHLDHLGGGTHVMMMINILKEYFEIYVDRDVEYYTSPLTPWSLPAGSVKYDEGASDYDVHLYADYNGWIEPRGRMNMQIMYFPLKKPIDGWDRLLVLSEFLKKQCDLFYPGRARVIGPYYDPHEFSVAEKTNSIINIGHYFIESDGHSKNQHCVIEWFKSCQNFDELIFHGRITNPRYFDYLKSIAESDSRIKIFHDESKEVVRRDLSRSKYMVHAMGYGRSNPAQTEHFGLVALEALLSGCQPIVHNSGGCPEISGVLTYNQFTDLTFSSTNPDRLRSLGMQYSIQRSKQQMISVMKEFGLYK